VWSSPAESGGGDSSLKKAIFAFAQSVVLDRGVREVAGILADIRRVARRLPSG
jgi:hypothetical protein